MRKSIAFGILTMTLAASAGNLLKNSTFGEDAPRYGAMPPKWQAENLSVWEYIDDDGIVIDNGCNCLRYKGKGNEGVPVAWQEFLSEKGVATYVVAADLKACGCSPSVLVKDSDGNVLATLKTSMSNVWQAVFKEFRYEGEGKLKVELQGSLNGQSGFSCFDNVRVLTGKLGENQAELSRKAKFVPAGPNIALGKKYTLEPRPNYSYCTDPDDDIQLTDGIYTKGYFWTQKSTVGWRGGRGYITIDLEKRENICGASFNTAGGRAGVAFPSAITVFTSDDGRKWAFAGDLAVLGTVNGAPAFDSYSIFRYASNDIKGSGRYVKFVVFGTNFLFVDEIEIYGGGDGGTAEASIDNPVRFTENMAFETGARQRVRGDLDNMELRLAEAGLLDDETKAKIQAVGQKIPRMYGNLANPNDVKAVFPLGLQHEQAEVWALNSKLMEKVGYKQPFVWKNNRWKNLDINEIPKDSGIRSIEVEMMRNEVRGETFNICNPTGERLDGHVAVEGIPKEANLTVNEVLFTDTAIRKPVSDAIVPMDSDSPFTLFAGCNKQIWLSFKRPACKAGVYDGRINVTAGGQMVATIPLKLRIYDMDFPRQPSVHLGGWDYTNLMGKYYHTPNCVEATIAIMKDTYVDSPWATNAVMPKGAKFDHDGHLQNPKELDFSAWDKWTDMWKGARKYCVFWSIGDKFNGVPPSDPRFANMVTEYVNAWMAYVKEIGFNPKDVVVLLYDEPSREEQAKKIMDWARPIKERCPEFTIFEDPCFSDPRPVDPEFFKLSDVLCPMTRMIHAQWKFPQDDPTFHGNFRDFYVQKRKEGAELWLYSCSGPSRTLDPITYHRGQFWRCVDMGATGSMYWAFGCGGGIGNSWQPYAHKHNEYSPYFVGQDAPANAKHNEAIREGVQDYEYFIMLAKKIETMKAQGKDEQANVAQAVYDKALAHGLSTLPHIEGNDIDWNNDNHHERMDEARISVLRELAK